MGSKISKVIDTNMIAQKIENNTQNTQKIENNTQNVKKIENNTQNTQHIDCEECLICFENYTKNNPKRNLLCNKNVPHFLCNNCYNKMYISNNRKLCPFCRRDMHFCYHQNNSENQQNVQNFDNCQNYIVGNPTERRNLTIFIYSEHQILPATKYAEYHLEKDFFGLGHIYISVNPEKYRTRLNNNEIWYHFS